MKTRFSRFVQRAAALAPLALAASSASTPASVERMYVFNCGEIAIRDISHWSPGVNVGRPFEFSNNCYLIRHADGWMLWDSGYSDAVAARPAADQAGGGPFDSRQLTGARQEQKGQPLQSG
jgi:N-acyl homoserine lactone hydrolase